VTDTTGHNAIDLYTRTGEVRALIAAIPILGGPIDALISTRGSALAERRMLSLLDDLRESMTLIDGDKVDRTYLGSEEFADLMMRALRAAAQTRDREQIRVYAAILVGATTTERAADFDSESALSAIAELSPVEVELARLIHDRAQPLGGGVHGWGNPYEWLPTQFKNDHLVFHLKRIERTGLIHHVVRGGPVGPTVEYYEVTPTFVRIMELLAAKPSGNSDGSTRPEEPA